MFLKRIENGWIYVRCASLLIKFSSPPRCHGSSYLKRTIQTNNCYIQINNSINLPVPARSKLRLVSCSSNTDISVSSPWCMPAFSSMSLFSCGGERRAISRSPFQGVLLNFNPELEKTTGLIRKWKVGAEEEPEFIEANGIFWLLMGRTSTDVRN